MSAESLGLLLYIAQSNGTKLNLEWVIEVKDFNLAGYDEKLSPGLIVFPGRLNQHFLVIAEKRSKDFSTRGAKD